MQAKFLPTAQLSAWLDELAQGKSLLVPKREGDAVVFGAYTPGTEVDLSRDATSPPKSAVFPACEELLRFTYEKDPEDPSKTKLSFEPTMPEGQVVVFGARPCGTRGFVTYDRVFDSDKGVRDPYYAARRELTAFITMACAETGNTCFCNWVGSSPSDPQGSDVLMTPVADGYVLEAVTPKGEKLLSSKLLADAGKKTDEAAKVKAEAASELPGMKDLSGAPKALLAAFDDMGFWEKMSAKCISCGACTYLCPTCYCFNITDETKGMQGSRLRSWDNCMSFQFTLEASGHNPRPTKAHRLKNRVGHKFSYYPNIHGGAIACCGCGRCIKSCPAGVDIREIVLASLAREASQPQE